MPDTPPSEKQSGGEGLALGIAALAMIGCCGLPLLLALASSVAIGTLLGVGGGVLAAIVLVAIVLTRRSRRRACSTPPPERRHALDSHR